MIESRTDQPRTRPVALRRNRVGVPLTDSVAISASQLRAAKLARPPDLVPVRLARGLPQPFTSRYLLTFAFFASRSSTAPCSTPSPYTLPGLIAIVRPS